MKNMLKSKKIIMTLLILLLVLGLLFGINMYLKSSKNNVTSSVKDIVNKYNFDNVSTTKEIGKTQTKSASKENIYYKVEYPVIGNDKIDKDIQEKVDELINDKVTKYKSTNSNSSYYLLDYETYIGLNYTLNVVFKSVVEDKDLKTLEQTTNVYNYNLINGNLLKKSDVFKGDYFNKLKGYDDTLTKDFIYIIKNDILVILNSGKEISLSELKDYLKLDIKDTCKYTNTNKEVQYEVINAQYKILKDSVLYSEPSMDGKIIDKVGKDELISVYSQGSNSWSIVFYNDKIGYIESKNLIKVNKEDNGNNEIVDNNKNNENINKVKVYAITDVNIRDNANNNSNILGVLKNGESIDKIGESGSWTQVLYNDQTAYIASSCLSSVKIEKHEVKLNVSPQGNIDPKKPMVALTFDDGPNPVSTPMILDTLEKYKVHATFFDLGNLVVRYPDVVKREALNGEVGTHTYSHKNLNTLSVDAINQELKLSREASKKVLGTEPILLRPPYGNANATVKALANMPIINWDVDSLDWKYRNKDLTLNEIYKYGNLDGHIILMHSIYTSTAEAVAILVPDLLDKGYQIVSVSEMASYRGYTLQTGTIYHNFR